MNIVIFTAPELGETNREVGYIMPDGNLFCFCCGGTFEKDEYVVEKELSINTDNTDIIVAASRTNYIDSESRLLMLANNEEIVIAALLDTESMELVFHAAAGDTVDISGDSAEFGLEDYNVRVSTPAVVEALYRDGMAFVTLAEIDGDRNVAATIPLWKARYKE